MGQTAKKWRILRRRLKLCKKIFLSLFEYVQMNLILMTLKITPYKEYPLSPTLYGVTSILDYSLPLPWEEDELWREVGALSMDNNGTGWTSCDGYNRQLLCLLYVENGDFP
ncbi:hypothetical protein AVEN_21931-1 [Araneus ventricosus]|uniref:Uncharacterized protein n=1 Tax=Araneus ventricosus TaxID=182803 RepID=A0A4Y2D1Q1_ARAVE|nr:hypothetical protein AVEN_21931-1 [Araneus ventricosus]